jgi:ABC-type nitrate/sulfonate/bicarbonate transport system substrate-binding protein
MAQQPSLHRLIFVAALAVLVLTGMPAAALGQDLVRIGTGVDPVYVQWWVAQEKGFFKKYNIQADIKQFTGGPEMSDAVMAGEVDFASSGTATLMPRIARGNLLVVSTISTSSDAYKLAARTSIRSPADLRGKRVGTVAGSTTDYLWTLLAKRYSIPENELQLVSVQPPELIPSLDRGDIQAFLSWEPWPSRAVEISGKDKVLLLLTSGDFGYFLNFIAVVNRKFSDAKPDATARVLAAVREASNFINTNRAEAVQIGAQWSRIKPELSAAIMNQYEYGLSLTDDMRKAARDEEAWMRGKGRIKANPIDWTKTIDPRFFEKAKTM